MFRDLKEYQEIQKIYEERVCITEEERYIIKELEETFTEDEIIFIAENTEEVFAEIHNQLIEEGTDISEENINEILAAAKRLIPQAAKRVGGFVKNLAKSKPVVGGTTKSLSGGATKSLAGGTTKPGASGIVKKVTNTVKDKVGGLKDKVGGLKDKASGVIKKGVQFVKKNPMTTVGLGAGGVGLAVGAGKMLSQKNKSKVETDSTGKVIPSTAEIRAQNKGRVGGGNAGGSTDSGGTQGQGGAPEIKKPAPKATEKPMHSIEKKNRARFGDAHVDKLKAKNADFKAMRKGSMSKDDFIKKYPKSITAQKAAGLRDHTEWDAYDMVLEYLFSTEQVSTIEEANYVMMQMEQETIGEIVNEVTYYLDEGIIDSLKAGTSKLGSLVKKGIEAPKNLIKRRLGDTGKSIGKTAGKVGSSAGKSAGKVGSSAGKSAGKVVASK